jgi:hypothetical protein
LQREKEIRFFLLLITRVDFVRRSFFKTTKKNSRKLEDEKRRGGSDEMLAK